MSNLNAAPPCRCCSSVRAYIEDHLDPHAQLKRTDNATKVVKLLDATFRLEGGSGVTVEQMRAYLAQLGESHD
jgi:hypothetical protein